MNSVKKKQSKNLYLFLSIFISLFPYKKLNSEAETWVKSEVRRIHNFHDPCAPSAIVA